MSFELAQMAGVAVLPDGGTAYTKALLAYLCARADQDTGKGWSSIASMGRAAVATRNTVRTEKRRLERWGAVTFDRSGPGRGHVYRFTVQRGWLARHVPQPKGSRGDPFPTAEKGHPVTQKGHPVTRKGSPGDPEQINEQNLGTSAREAARVRSAPPRALAAHDHDARHDHEHDAPARPLRNGHDQPEDIMTDKTTTPRESDERMQWRARFRGYKHPGGFWPSQWGPRPGEPNCQAPADLVAECLGKPNGTTVARKPVLRLVPRTARELLLEIVDVMNARMAA